MSDWGNLCCICLRGTKHSFDEDFNLRGAHCEIHGELELNCHPVFKCKEFLSPVSLLYQKVICEICKKEKECVIIIYQKKDLNYKLITINLNLCLDDLEKIYREYKTFQNFYSVKEELQCFYIEEDNCYNCSKQAHSIRLTFKNTYFDFCKKCFLNMIDTLKKKMK